MTLLVLSPDFASHYGPLAVLARAARDRGRRVVVATGPGLRDDAERDGFEWRPLQLGAGSNDGIVSDSPAVRRFLAATRAGAAATVRRQALDREHDLLWEPERVAVEVARLCDALEPDDVLVDHVSFGSTLAMHATGRPFTTVVPGHPSQLPVAGERYGIPSPWPTRPRPAGGELAELEALADRVTAAFTARWNDALGSVAPDRAPVDDAYRVHGRRVLYNSVAELQHRGRSPDLPPDHRFVGPLVRDEPRSDELLDWMARDTNRPLAYVAFGTFLSRRADVLRQVAEALRRVDVRAAIALGPTPAASLGPIPGDWLVAPRLPQVALLGAVDVAIHHGGNNSVQESLAAGVAQLVLPFSTDQFANAADLERVGRAAVLDPNDLDAVELADTVRDALDRPPPAPVRVPSPDELVAALDAGIDLGAPGG